MLTVAISISSPMPKEEHSVFNKLLCRGNVFYCESRFLTQFCTQQSPEFCIAIGLWLMPLKSLSSFLTSCIYHDQNCFRKQKAIFLFLITSVWIAFSKCFWFKKVKIHLLDERNCRISFLSTFHLPLTPNMSVLIILPLLRPQWWGAILPYFASV